MGLFHTHTTELVPYESRVVHEGVSADKATEILQGFEQKALSNVLEEFRLEGNTLNGRLLISENVVSLDREAFVIFELNGKRHEVSVPLKHGYQLDKVSAARMMAEEISKAVTNSILKGAMNEVAQYLNHKR